MIKSRYDWQQHPDPNSQSETFADMFVAWTYNAWNTDVNNAGYVTSAQNWMNDVVP